MFKKPSHVVILVFLIIGVVFTAVGLFLTLVVVPSLNTEIANLEQMETVNSVALADSRPGKRVLVEGQVSSANPAQLDTFVAYVREEYQTDSSAFDDDDDSGWVIRQQIRPPLLVESSGAGPVQITNESYNLVTGKIIEQDSRTRFRVIEVGDPLVVIGELTNSGEPPQLTAEVVYFGSKAEYVAGQQDAAASTRLLATVFLVLGILFLVAGIGVVIAVVVQ